MQFNKQTINVFGFWDCCRHRRCRRCRRCHVYFFVCCTLPMLPNHITKLSYTLSPCLFEYVFQCSLCVAHFWRTNLTQTKRNEKNKRNKQTNETNKYIRNKLFMSIAISVWILGSRSRASMCCVYVFHVKEKERVGVQWMASNHKRYEMAVCNLFTYTPIISINWMTFCVQQQKQQQHRNAFALLRLAQTVRDCHCYYYCCCYYSFGVKIFTTISYYWNYFALNYSA